MEVRARGMAAPVVVALRDLTVTVALVGSN